MKVPQLPEPTMAQLRQLAQEDQVATLAKGQSDLSLFLKTILTGRVGLADNCNVGFHTLERLNVPDDWVVPTVAANWADVGSGYASFAVRKEGDGSGTCHMKGRMANSAGTAAGATVCTLTAPYRPAGHEVITSEQIGAIWPFFINSDGTVVTGAIVTATNACGFRATWTASDRTPVVPACFPYAFQNPISGIPQGVLPVYVEELSTAKLNVGALSLDWQYTTDRKVQIRNIPGLIPNKSYKIVFMVF